jgi:hypothetical protein
MKITASTEWPAAIMHGSKAVTDVDDRTSQGQSLPTREDRPNWTGTGAPRNLHRADSQGLLPQPAPANRRNPKPVHVVPVCHCGCRKFAPRRPIA